MSLKHFKKKKNEIPYRSIQKPFKKSLLRLPLIAMFHTMNLELVIFPKKEQKLEFSTIRISFEKMQRNSYNYSFKISCTKIILRDGSLVQILSRF